MPKFIQRDLNDPKKLKIETRTHADKNTVCEAPEGEEIDWLDIADVIDPTTGKVSGKKAIVNSAKKKAALKKKQERKDKDTQRKQKREARLLQYRQAYKDMDKIVKDEAKLTKLLRSILIDLANVEE